MKETDREIDANGRILGRLATEIALLLRAKDSAWFDPARSGMRRVIVFHTDGIRVSGRKVRQKLYRRHSGYPGGLKEESYERLFARDSGKVLYRAVNGMLPKNRLRARLMKNLIIYKSAITERS